MMFRITLSFDLDLDDQDDASFIGMDAAQHLMDTYNDDESIKVVEWAASPANAPTPWPFPISKGQVAPVCTPTPDELEAAETAQREEHHVRTMVGPTDI